ncbi:hypothetical protein A2348_02155 [Candidatus Uhrbacteria bacterium RIFOXYB12_FULL_58_10]|nr:MAG: hypothetical protein A2348_02155 [Candidatus Uhrbacteria bacterium RIFOXYB12_FULL_58_10]
MRLARSFVLVLLSFVFVFGHALPVLAGACFCNIEGAGATQNGNPVDAAACQTSCDGVEKSVGYLYALDVTQYPSSLLQCFSKKELCDSAGGKFDSKQPAECPPGWHYCYPVDTEKYTLQISIPSQSGGEVTQVSNYGEYVGAIYKYLLGFAVTTAIVFVMVGGIRYVVGASTGEIGKAKDMIVKAVSGLVLLLFAYVILYTVNPELIRLQVPKLPMIRQVLLLEGGEDCKSLKDKGYTVDDANAVKGNYAKFLCGTVAAVTKDPAGSVIPEGKTCVYNACAAPDPTCGEAPSDNHANALCVSAGNDYRCVQCGQITPGNSCNIAPSAGLCSSLDPADSFVNTGAANPPYDRLNLCGFTHSPSMVSTATGVTAATAAALVGGGAITAIYGAAVSADAITGTCAYMSLNCNEVTACESYDGMKAYNSIVTNGQELDDLNYSSLGTPSIVEICSQDPCQIGKKTGKTCTFVEGKVKSDCVSK